MMPEVQEKEKGRQKKISCLHRRHQGHDKEI